MSKGFLWFCQNSGDVDYVELTKILARSIKRHNRQNNICVVTDDQSKFSDPNVDVVKVMRQDDSENHDKKFANEHKAFSITPFTHTIKLEADMLWNANTDWWWNFLCQHDLIFSLDCLDFRENPIKDKFYRPYHECNFLPNIYSGMTYFRKSNRAKEFYENCRTVSDNWHFFRDNILLNCFDELPTTDVVYALAYRILDPLQQKLIDYPWFKFIHNKDRIHGSKYRQDGLNYYYPLCINEKLFFGGRRLSAPLHYYEKNFMEEVNARIF